MNSTHLNPADQLTDALLTSMLALGLPPDKRDAIELIRQRLAIHQAWPGQQLEAPHVIALRNAVANAREVLSSL